MHINDHTEITQNMVINMQLATNKEYAPLTIQLSIGKDSSLQNSFPKTSQNKSGYETLMGLKRKNSENVISGVFIHHLILLFLLAKHIRRLEFYSPSEVFARYY